MKNKETQKVDQEVVTSVTCDICGNECKSDYGVNAIEIKTYWGFDSKKDLQYWEADVCEDCVDKHLSPLIKFKKSTYYPFIN